MLKEDGWTPAQIMQRIAMPYLDEKARAQAWRDAEKEAKGDGLIQINK